MEEHRLKPMKAGYDEKFFNELYKKTEGLRRSLAFEIDSRRFGVDYNEILSWFNIKFIYAYNKYCDKVNQDLLKGYVINSLQMFKYRVMREAYSKKNEQYSNQLNITDTAHFENLISTDEEHKDEKSYEAMLQATIKFMKRALSRDAFLIFEIQLNMPSYILERLDDPDVIPSNIPNKILAEYLNLPESKKVLDYLNDLKQEIYRYMEVARRYFKIYPVRLAA